MTDTSRPPFELREKLDPVMVEIIRSVASVCESLNVRFFLVGAVARDVVLANVFGRPDVEPTTWTSHSRSRVGSNTSS